MARNDGNKSYQELLVRIYNKNLTGTFKNTAEADTGLRSLPLSIIRAGNYNYIYGERNNRESHGVHLESCFNDTGKTRILFFSSVYYYLQYDSDKGNGQSVRCVAKPPLLFLNKARNFSPTNCINLCYN